MSLPFQGDLPLVLIGTVFKGDKGDKGETGETGDNRYLEPVEQISPIELYTTIGCETDHLKYYVVSHDQTSTFLLVPPTKEGLVIMIRNNGYGTTQIIPDFGVVINSPGTNKVSVGGGTVILVSISNNQWDLIGNVVPNE